MPNMMHERRRERRLEDFNEVTLSVRTGENNFHEKISHIFTEDISESGARIYATAILPVDALVQIEMKIENMHQIITTPGQVVWAKAISSDESCEAGLEFVSTPAKSMKTLDRYISWIGMLYPA